MLGSKTTSTDSENGYHTCCRTSVNANNNSPIHGLYVHPDDHIQPTYEMTPGLKPFTNQHLIDYELTIHILFITDSWVN